MDFLFLIVLVALLFLVIPKPGEPGGVKSSDMPIRDKTCPPHKWEYREILNHRGESEGQRMVCAVCNQTPGYVGRGDE